MSRFNETRTETSRDDYETPENVLVRVRAVLGEIGLDPFTSSANPTKASFFLLSEGFKQWSSVVPEGVQRTAFVNPPYGRALGAAVRSVILNIADGWEIITLTPARPDTRWYHALVTAADMYADIRGRLTFNLNGVPTVNAKTGKPQPAQFPSTLTYFGPYRDRFADVMAADGFARIAQVVEP